MRRHFDVIMTLSSRHVSDGVIWHRPILPKPIRAINWPIAPLPVNQPWGMWENASREHNIATMTSHERRVLSNYRSFGFLFNSLCGHRRDRWWVNSPHKGPVTRKWLPFDDVTMRTVWMMRILVSKLGHRWFGWKYSMSPVRHQAIS